MMVGSGRLSSSLREALSDSSSATPELLEQLIRDAGFLIAEADPSSLAQMRRDLATIQMKLGPADAHADAVLETLEVVAAAVAATVSARADEANAHVAFEPLRAKVLAALSESAQTPSQLAAALGADRSSVSKALRQLLDAGEVGFSEPVPGSGEDMRTRTYHLSEQPVEPDVDVVPVLVPEVMSDVASAIVTAMVAVGAPSALAGVAHLVKVPKWDFVGLDLGERYVLDAGYLSGATEIAVIEAIDGPGSDDYRWAMVKEVEHP